MNHEHLPEQNVPSEKAKKFFSRMREIVEHTQNPLEPHAEKSATQKAEAPASTFRTGASAEADWQREKEEKEDAQWEKEHTA